MHKIDQNTHKTVQNMPVCQLGQLLCGFPVDLRQKDCRMKAFFRPPENFQMAIKGFQRDPFAETTTPFCSIFCVDSFLLIQKMQSKTAAFPKSKKRWHSMACRGTKKAGWASPLGMFCLTNCGTKNMLGQAFWTCFV